MLFAVAGIGIVETAEHAAGAALAPNEIRGSAFGLLAATQSFGNLASAVAGLLWTLVSPGAAFLYLASWMLASLVALGRFSTAPHRAHGLLVRSRSAWLVALGGNRWNASSNRRPVGE